MSLLHLEGGGAVGVLPAGLEWVDGGGVGACGALLNRAEGALGMACQWSSHRSCQP
jgi:hypothetical protein